jgi:DNA modification methylase
MIRDRIQDLRRVRAGDLRPSPKNWRRHPESQRKAMQAALAEIGFADALLARETDDGLELIDGHLRADLDPEQQVPVLVLDVDEQEAGKLLATLDPLAGMAEADLEALKLLASDLDWQMPDLEMVVTDLVGPGGIEGVVEDVPPDPPADPVTKPGDIWLLGDHRLLCGDSTKREDVERVMRGETAAAVMTDPPYGVDYVGKTKDALTVRNDGAEGLRPLLTAALGNALAVCHEGGIWYIAAPAGPQFADFATVLTDLGVWRQTLVWVKDSMVLGRSDYHYRHEAIFYGWKPGKAHKEPPDRRQTTVWEIPRPKASREHPTMKPVALYAKMMSNSTAVGSVIYEPFAGSGTTFIAAEQLGRRCVGIELDPGYVDVVVNRWEALTGRKATQVTGGAAN